MHTVSFPSMLSCLLLLCVSGVPSGDSHSVHTPFRSVVPASGAWRYSFINSHSDTVAVSVQTSSDKLALSIWKESWDGPARWSSLTSPLDVQGASDLEGTFNLEVRGSPGTIVEGSFIVHCGRIESAQTEQTLLAGESVENYQWYNHISQGQVATYRIINRFASSSTIAVKLTPLDSSCDPDLYIFKGPWSGAYGWKSTRGYGEDAVTISSSATLKDITGAYTIEVHGGVPGLYVLRVAISYTQVGRREEVPVQKVAASDNVEEYYWFHTVKTDATDYYFFKNRYQNTVSIDFRLTPLSPGDPDLKIYKGQWTGVYDWTSSHVSGEEVISVKPTDYQLEKRGGIVGDYAIEIRGVFAAVYKIEVKIYYNHGWRSTAAYESAVLQRDEKSFLFVRNIGGLSPGDVAFLELEDGRAEAMLTVHVPQPSSITVTLTPCLSAMDLFIPPEQLTTPVTYELHRGEIFATFFAVTPCDIRLLVKGDDPDFLGKLPYRIAVESTESFERTLRENLIWETLGNDKLVVSWPPLRLSTPGTVSYRVFLSLATTSDTCGISGHDLEVETTVPTAVLTLTEDAGTRAINVLAEIEGEGWHASVPYMRKHIGVEGWNWVRITVLAGLVAAVAVVCWKRKGASWTGVNDDEVYRRLIEEKE